MFSKLIVCAALLFSAGSAGAEPYLVADRLIPEKLRVLGVAGLSPEGCPSGSAACSNIVITGEIERVGYVDKEDFPNLLRVRDLINGRIYSIRFPYEEIQDSIGTADATWIYLWPKAGMKVTIIGTIGGSAGVVSVDSIYDSDFLAGKDD